MAVGISTDLIVRFLAVAVTIGTIYGLMREKLMSLQKSADELRTIAATLKTGMDQQIIINRSFEQRLDSHRDAIADLKDTTQELDKRVAVVEDRCSVRANMGNLRNQH